MSLALWLEERSMTRACFDFLIQKNYPNLSTIVRMIAHLQPNTAYEHAFLALATSRSAQDITECNIGVASNRRQPQTYRNVQHLLTGSSFPLTAEDRAALAAFEAIGFANEIRAVVGEQTIILPAPIAPPINTAVPRTVSNRTFTSFRSSMQQVATREFTISAPAIPERSNPDPVSVRFEYEGGNTVPAVRRGLHGRASFTANTNNVYHAYSGSLRVSSHARDMGGLPLVLQNLVLVEYAGDEYPEYMDTVLGLRYSSLVSTHEEIDHIGAVTFPTRSVNMESFLPVQFSTPFTGMTVVKCHSRRQGTFTIFNYAIAPTMITSTTQTPVNIGAY